MNAKLGTEDVVKLIEACKNAGVTKLKFDKLELHFTQVTTLSVQDLAQARAVHPKSVETFIRQDEDLRDIEMENLMITDPLAYEDQLRKASYATHQSGLERDVLEE